ncbi:hypothetical protein COU60_02370 [Candidatus Pacearchaeota archaeon CG10_big_fil_rev_8_21_14_0_10_34_76]|nr:MAG: hypothetical protein COU60_02370 [Candidatus Pacearchaeota archaeon CG10_big_fil_rev_8_21_14_0_10_34_76]
MSRRVAVGDVMTRNFVSVTPNTNLQKCAKEMVSNRVNSLMISENRKLLGILTARDILWTIIKKPSINLAEINVRDIATKKVAVIKPSADISQALHKMKQFGFRRLPVLFRGDLVGLVTLKDILRVDPGLYNQLGELADIREETDKIKRLSIMKEDWESEGLCDECGSLSDLMKIEKRMLCSDCRNELY